MSPLLLPLLTMVLQPPVVFRSVAPTAPSHEDGGGSYNHFHALLRRLRPQCVPPTTLDLQGCPHSYSPRHSPSPILLSVVGAILGKKHRCKSYGFQANVAFRSGISPHSSVVSFIVLDHIYPVYLGSACTILMVSNDLKKKKNSNQTLLQR